ncbi:MAG: hypothetical protein WC787_03245 [Patescibacteria group bacterium]|jgi:hypothetical protein
MKEDVRGLCDSYNDLFRKADLIKANECAADVIGKTIVIVMTGTDWSRILGGTITAFGASIRGPSEDEEWCLSLQTSIVHPECDDISTIAVTFEGDETRWELVSISRQNNEIISRPITLSAIR